MTIAFVTLGCKVNQVESDALRRNMAAAGYACVEPEASPDVLVVNSCAVTAESERKTRQKLNHFRALHRSCILVLTGCAAQINGAEAYPQADIVLGHRDIHALEQHLAGYLANHVRTAQITPHQRGELFGSAFPRESAHASPAQSTCALPAQSIRTRAHLKIEDGCNQFCAYCIIPHARGRVRSKPLDAIRQEAQWLDMQGVREIILVGINLAAYGSDLGCSLAEALQALDNLSNVQRVRLGSLEPDLLTPALLESIANISNIEICPHFHISLQSGSDSVLKRMNRHYSTEEYYALAERLRVLFPGASITTDVLVGFPGESEMEFEESLAFVRSVGFAKVHVFPFSARPGTAAAAMPGQLPRAEKQARAKKMLALAQECQANFLLSQIGKTLHVLPEEPHPQGGMQGYSEAYVPVRIADAGEQHHNKIVPVLVKEIAGEQCIAVLAR